MYTYIRIHIHVYTHIYIYISKYIHVCMYSIFELCTTQTTLQNYHTNYHTNYLRALPGSHDRDSASSIILINDVSYLYHTHTFMSTSNDFFHFVCGLFTTQAYLFNTSQHRSIYSTHHVPRMFTTHALSAGAARIPQQGKRILHLTNHNGSQTILSLFTTLHVCLPHAHTYTLMHHTYTRTYHTHTCMLTSHTHTTCQRPTSVTAQFARY